jgi:hypothetical protein
MKKIVKVVNYCSGRRSENLFKFDGSGVIALVMVRKVGKALDEKGATKVNWTWRMWSTLLDMWIGNMGMWILYE